MARYRITRVNVGMTTKDPHEHIRGVELNDSPSARISRETVVADLKNPNGDRYYTLAAGVAADVVVRSCPKCLRNDYITTDPDKTIRNNLLQLPRY